MFVGLSSLRVPGAAPRQNPQTTPRNPISLSRYPGIPGFFVPPRPLPIPSAFHVLLRPDRILVSLVPVRRDAGPCLFRTCSGLAGLLKALSMWCQRNSCWLAMIVVSLRPVLFPGEICSAMEKALYKRWVFRLAAFLRLLMPPFRRLQVADRGTFFELRPHRLALFEEPGFSRTPR